MWMLVRRRKRIIPKTLMPTADVCGICHLQDLPERESERDTMIWPHGQWPDGRPSHALDYKANVRATVWAAMPQREVAKVLNVSYQPGTNVTRAIHVTDFRQRNHVNRKLVRPVTVV